MTNEDTKGDSSYSEDDEFETWEEMKKYDINTLHEELISKDKLRRFTAAKELQVRGRAETFIQATLLAESDKNSWREIAAFVLGQLGTPDYPFRGQSVPILISLLEDSEANVRAAAAASLGHLESKEAIPYLVSLISDADCAVRENVAFALGKMGDDRVVLPLLTLTHDKDCSVVKWAVVALRILNFALPDVCDRFFEMLNSDDEEILDEVICGLSQWGDKRVFPFLCEALNREEINLELIEAAGNLGDDRLLARLIRLKNNWGETSPRMLEKTICKLQRLGSHNES